jgi:hypothetical protein
MGSAVEGVIKCRLLSGPDTVLDLGVNTAAYRTVRADGTYLLDIAAGFRWRGRCFFSAGLNSALSMRGLSADC